MNKPKLLIAALAASLFFSIANAQVDTAKFDLGRMQLSKDFTQNVTVKGDDLAKMPFDNLADAINVWFNGSYTNKATLVYVIDGNLVNDVNAYSIYDIDEVTLVQNAVTQLNGSIQNQQLVLIKTKRPKGKGIGVTANGQADVSSMYTNNVLNAQNDNNSYQTGLNSKTSVYQQYYVSAYKNTDNIQFGASADYLGDAIPQLGKAGTLYDTPESFRRLRFNGYFDARMGNSLLDVTAGYAPQKDKAAFEDKTASEGNFPVYDVNENFEQNEGIFNSSIKLTTHILPGLINVVHGDYNDYHANANEAVLESYGGDSSVSVTANKISYHSIVAYDNLSYTAKFGAWGLTPAANLSFRTFRDSSYSASFGVDNGNDISSSTAYFVFKEHLFQLTPSVNLYYKNYFNIEGGLLYNIAIIGEVNLKPKKTLPFVTASADVMRLIDPASSLSVKVYGSYSVSSFLEDEFNSLEDFSSSSQQIPVLGSMNNEETALYSSSGSYLNFAYQLQDATKTFKTFSAGLTISPGKSGLGLSYFFERRNYLSPVFVPEPFGGNEVEESISYNNTNSTMHRLAVDYTVINSSSFNWHTNINATLFEEKFPVNYGPGPVLGGNEWTGGWVNRLNYRSFFAGADVLYQAGAKVYTVQPPSYYTITLTKINSFSLQNLYAGYRVKAAGLHNLEIFVNARNSFQNQKAIITDNRKYYGLGFSLTL